MSERAIGIVDVADYLLYYLNKHSMFSYVDVMKLKCPHDSLKELIYDAAISLDMKQTKVNKENGEAKIYPDTPVICLKFLDNFRKGLFGKIGLDTELISDFRSDHKHSFQ